MNIAFRVDASYQIGTGHVMRCVALAECLRTWQCEIRFFCRDLPGNLNAWLEGQMGFAVSVLKDSPDELDAMRDTLQLAPPPGGWDWLVVDQYEWDADRERAMRPLARGILVIDDLADRPHDCDVLLDQNYFKHPETRYQGLVPPHCDVLLGPTYALLRPEFAEWHRRLGAPAVPERRPIRNLLVSFGGSDPTGETEKVLSALTAMTTECLTIDVILGGSNPAADRVMAMAARLPGVICHRQVNDMAQRMAEADLFIGAGGTTTWERMALGLPGVVIAVADNQLAMSTALADDGYQVFLGESAQVDADAIREALSFLIRQPGLCRAMGERGLSQVDGLGCQRVAQILMSKSIGLRPATFADAELMFEWRNHAETRRYSLHADLISWESHQQWLRHSLDDSNRMLLIAEQAGQAVGVLRYDCLPSDVELSSRQCKVSVYRTPHLATPGIGTAMIKAGSRWLREHRPDIHKIQAEILPDNIASRRAFEKAGYVLHYQIYEYALGAPRTPGPIGS